MERCSNPNLNPETNAKPEANSASNLRARALRPHHTLRCCPRARQRKSRRPPTPPPTPTPHPQWGGHLLELDETKFEWGTLYELECETVSRPAGQARLSPVHPGLMGRSASCPRAACQHSCSAEAAVGGQRLWGMHTSWGPGLHWAVHAYRSGPSRACRRPPCPGPPPALIAYTRLNPPTHKPPTNACRPARLPLVVRRQSRSGCVPSWRPSWESWV